MNETTGFKMSGLRWLIIGLVFFVTVINYIDRMTISVLAPVITKIWVYQTPNSARFRCGF